MRISAFVGTALTILAGYTAWGLPTAPIVAPTVALAVILGGFGLTLVSQGWRQVVVALTGSIKACLTDGPDTERQIERLVGFAEVARREGILALEQCIDERDDRFVAKSVRLAVDGTEPVLIQDIQDVELKCLERAYRRDRRTLMALCRNFLAFAALLSLLLVSTVGGSEGLLSAAAPLLYGCVAGLVARVLAGRIEERGVEDLASKRLVMRGVQCIQEGDNPRIVEVLLAPYGSRPQGQPDVADQAPSAGYRTGPLAALAAPLVTWRRRREERRSSGEKVVDEDVDIEVEEDDIVVEETS